MLTANHLGLQANKVGLEFQELLQLQNLNLSSYLNVSDSENINQRADQRELKLWHDKLAHADMQLIQQLMRKPSRKQRSQVIKPKLKAALSCPRLMCGSCQIGRQVIRTPRIQGMKRDFKETIKIDHLVPGQCIFTDQYMSSVPG